MSDADNIQRRAAIESLESSIRANQLNQLQTSQINQLQASQQQLLMMQTELARSREQSRFSLFGAPTGLKGALDPRAGFSAGPTGMPTQGFGQLVGTGLVQPALRSLTFGALYPAAGFQFGSNSTQEIARARDELSFRMFTETGNAVMRAILPQAALSRMSGFADIVAGGSIQRGLAGQLDSLRGADFERLRAAGGALPSFGARLDSDVLERARRGVTSQINALRDRYGSGALTNEDVERLGGLASRFMETSDVVSAARSGDIGGALGRRGGSIVLAINELTRALRSNVEQTEALTKEYQESMGGRLGLSTARTVASAIRDTGVTTGLSNAQLAQYVGLPAAQRALGLGYDPGMYAATAVGRFAQTMGDYQSGLISDAQLFRFGGGSEAEAGIRREQYMQNMRTNLSRRFSGLFGVLPGGVVSNNLADTFGRVGRAYIDNPYAALEAEQSASTMQRSEASVMYNAYSLANQMASQMGAPQSMAISMFQRLTGEQSAIFAGEEYRSFSRRADRMRPFLNKASLSEGSMGMLLGLEDAARAAGYDPFSGVGPTMGQLYTMLGGGPVSAELARMTAAVYGSGGATNATVSRLLGDGTGIGGAYSSQNVSSLVNQLVSQGVLGEGAANSIGQALSGTVFDPFDSRTVNQDLPYFDRASGVFREGRIGGLMEFTGLTRDKIVDAVLSAMTSGAPLSGKSFGRFMRSATPEYRNVLSRLSAFEGPSLSSSDLDILTNLDTSNPEQVTKAGQILNNAFSDRERSFLRSWMFTQGSSINFSAENLRDGTSESKALYVQMVDS